MKKILIVNNNMKVGGVQKSLCNLIWEIKDRYDVTLLLFKNTGAYADMLPSDIKIVEPRGSFSLLGASQGEYRGIAALKRGFLALYSKIFGRRAAMKILVAGEKKLEEHYDCAISFLHNGRSKSIYGGVQNYVLDCVSADKKVAFLHCDYRNCGSDNPDTNLEMEQFDRIAACSDGCRAAFESVLPHLKDRCTTVRNCHRFEEIRVMSENSPIIYDDNYVNVLMVARVSHEKGIDRAIKAVAKTIEKQIPVKLHIVGGGALLEDMRVLSESMNVSDSVFFYGEQSNPYRYMKNADLLLICSYHEAAPMVIDEARSLGLPILTTETTSSFDMVIQEECGFVCENTQEALENEFVLRTSDRQTLSELKLRLKNNKYDNSIALAQFDKIIDN